MEYLGHIIPTFVKALKGFLGLTGYYRKFIRHSELIAAPLTALLKNNSFVWTHQAEAAFQQLKFIVSQPPVLALPDFSLPFTIECDASGVGLGAVLMQNQRPIAFHSQVLKGKALHLSTYEKELLALVTAVHKWRPYLLGRPFIIKTDQQSLKYLLEQRIATPAQQKWLTKLLGYLFVVEYKKGIENKVANALSRRVDPAAIVQSGTSSDCSSSLCLISFPCPSWINELKASYHSDPTMLSLL